MKHDPTASKNEAARDVRALTVEHLERKRKRLEKRYATLAGLVQVHVKGKLDCVVEELAWQRGQAARMAKKPGGFGKK